MDAEAPASDVDLESVVAKSSGVAEVEIDAERLVWGPASWAPMHLDPPSSVIWSCLDGSSPLGEIAADLAYAYAAPEPQVGTDVCFAVSALVREGLATLGSTDDPEAISAPFAERLAIPSATLRVIQRADAATLRFGSVIVSVSDSRVAEELSERLHGTPVESETPVDLYVTPSCHGPSGTFDLYNDRALPLALGRTLAQIAEESVAEIEHLESLANANGVCMRLAVLESADDVWLLQPEFLAARPALEAVAVEAGYTLCPGQYVAVDPATGVCQVAATERDVSGCAFGFTATNLDPPRTRGGWAWLLSLAACAGPHPRPFDRSGILELAELWSRTLKLRAVNGFGPSALEVALRTGQF